MASDSGDRLPPWLLWSKRPFPDTNIGDALSDHDVGWVNIALDGPRAAASALASLQRLADLGPALVLPTPRPAARPPRCRAAIRLPPRQTARRRPRRRRLVRRPHVAVGAGPRYAPG
jgi:hypothetical protein